MHRTVALLVLLVVTACGSDGAPSAGPSAPPVPDALTVSFETSDGVGLTGHLYGSGTIGVVLAHMFPAEDGAASWAPTAQRLAEEGYLALAVNFRGYADSEGEREIDRLHLDVEAAHDQLIERGAEAVAYVGASMGGTASLVAAAEHDPVAVVTVSAPAQFRGLDAEAVARELTMPVLLLAAEGDGAAAGSLEALAQLIPEAEAKLFGGDAHGTNLITDAPSSEDEILAFLEVHAPSR